MYCSSCGGALARNLDYCNHCGARLSNGKDRSESASAYPESLIWAIVAALAIGLGTTIGLMVVMKEVVHFNIGLITAFTALSFTLLFAVEGVFIWQLVRRTGAKAVADGTRIDKQATKELEAAPVRALPDPVPSVTEQTTRAFEPLYNERKSN